MNGKGISLKGVLVGLAFFLVIAAWAIGAHYQRGVFLGPYALGDRETPVYLELPVIATVDDDKGNQAWKNPFLEMGDYHQVAIYDIDLTSLVTVRPYPLSKSFPDPLSLKINFSSTISTDEAQKVVDAQRKHPKYWQNKAELAFYRFAGGFARLTHYYPVGMAVLCILALVWLWACRSAKPFILWWGVCCTYSLIYRGLYDFYLYVSFKSFSGFLYILLFNPGKMYAWPRDTINLPCVVCAVAFDLIGPILFLVIGWLYLIKHVIPKQRRLYEDFMKFDKDKEKKVDFNISDIEFKKVRYDIRKKLEEYRHKPELFLGVDDDNKDVSIPESLANQHIHIMGPTGCGKTATLMLPLAMQALEKRYGACFTDFKGDYALIKAIQMKCKELKIPFHYFSIDPRENTDPYNGLSSGDSYSKVDRIISALKLDQAGPARYYADQQRVAFIEILKNLIKLGMYISFPKVLLYLKDDKFITRLGIKPEDIAGLIASLSKIADYPMINEDGIDLKQIMDKGEVVYFNLKSQINTDLAEAIGRILIIDLKYWSAYRNEKDPKFFIFIDEFQTVASQFFIDVISKVRSANYCLVLANQSRANLINVSQAFHDAVMDNSLTKVIFNQFDGAEFWARQTGTNRVEEATMRMESGDIFNEEKTALDGKRVRDGVVAKVSKSLFTQNTFLMLPKGKSVVFPRGINGMTARLTNHEFYHTEAEWNEILSQPFVYEGGKKYGDPLEYLLKQQKEAAAKEKTDVNNVVQPKKEKENENSKSSFRFDGGGNGIVE